jgi:hypothetical protein
MVDAADFHKRLVFVGKQDEMERGSVELPSSFFERSGIEPDHHVVLMYGRKRYKVKARLGDMLKSGEVVVTPRIAALMNIKDGFEVHIHGRSSIGDLVFDEVEDVLDVLGDQFEEAKDRVFGEGAERRAERREKTLDRLIPTRTEEPPPRSIEVEPDLSRIGEGPEEEPVMDISEQVKVWSPDPEGDGVREWKPGREEEEEEE